MARIYLDNAATSWPKPDTVYSAVDKYQREIGAAAGRGAYQSAQQAQRKVSETRTACARLLGVAEPKQIVFTSNGTAALNLAIHGLLRQGDHVVTTVCEHNSVLRPLSRQAEGNGVGITFVDCDESGYVTSAQVADAISPKTRLVIVSHASNVTGALQPIGQIVPLVRDSNALLLVDAAQTAGCVPLDVGQLDVDLLACGGHKGLLGPLGTGLLYIRPGLEELLTSSIQGGTGTDSLSEAQPLEMPEKFESGNLNIPALAGLGAATKYLEEINVAAIQLHHQEMIQRLIAGLTEIPEVRIFGPLADQPRVGVVSCSIDGYDPHEFAAALDASVGVECRAGLHCAPRMHAALGTSDTGGLVRFSPGWATTSEDIDVTLNAITALIATPVN